LEIDRKYKSYWIPTKRADFDQQQIQICQKIGGDPLRPDADFPPSYIFRWASTGASHCQALMKTPDDETWYHRYQKTEERIGQIQKFVPLMDDQTEHLINRYSYS